MAVLPRREKSSGIMGSYFSSATLWVASDSRTGDRFLSPVLPSPPVYSHHAGQATNFDGLSYRRSVSTRYCGHECRIDDLRRVVHLNRLYRSPDLRFVLP